MPDHAVDHIRMMQGGGRAVRVPVRLTLRRRAVARIGSCYRCVQRRTGATAPLSAALSLCWLALEDPKRGELALGFDDVEYGLDLNAADEFVLQVGMTDVEPEFGQRTGTRYLPGRANGRCYETPLHHTGPAPVACAVRAALPPLTRT